MVELDPSSAIFTCWSVCWESGNNRTLIYISADPILQVNSVILWLPSETTTLELMERYLGLRKRTPTAVQTLPKSCFFWCCYRYRNWKELFRIWFVHRRLSDLELGGQLDMLDNLATFSLKKHLIPVSFCDLLDELGAVSAVNLFWFF